MVNLSLIFITFFNFAVFFLLFAFGSAWAYYCFKKGKGYFLTPAIIVSVLLFVAWGMLAGVDVDEVEHLHCSWMVFSGFLPFKDFWQHHAPIFWVLLAPLFAVLKPSIWVLNLGRILSGFIFALVVFSGWKVTKKVWQGQAKISMYLLLVFTSSIKGDFLCFRPDMFATLFLLLFVYLCLEIPQKRLSPSFFAGASFGLAEAFMFKQYLLFFLPIYIIWKDRNGLRAARTGIYLLGICFGILPLMFYLLDKDIIREFVFWVFNYNRKRIVFSVDFPIALAAIGTWGAYLLLRRYRTFKDSRALVLLVAFCLSTLSSLTHALLPFFPYNIGLWFILCSAMGSSQGLKNLIGKLPLLQRSLAAGLFLSLLLSATVYPLLEHKTTYFSDDKKVISRLIQYGSQDSCLVILPYHPIFSRDVSRLYGFWQFYLSEDYPELGKDITSKGMVEEVRRRKPAVALYILNGRNFLWELYQKKFISKDNYYDLKAFFRDGYTVKEIGVNEYFVRNDKL